MNCRRPNPARCARPALRLSTLALASAVLLGASAGSHANTTLWWDANGSGAGTGGSGLWDWGTASWADVATGIAPGAARRWPFDPDLAKTTRAVFGGSGGTVTLKENVRAAQLQFLSNGYTLAGSDYSVTLGGNGRAGVLNVASGVRTRVQTQLRNDDSRLPAELRGGGTLVLDAASAGPTFLRVFDATLELARRDAAAGSFVWLGDPAERLTWGSLGVLELGGLYGPTGSRLQIGRTQLHYTGLLPFGFNSQLSLVGDAESGLVLGSARRLSSYSWSGGSLPSSIGFVDLLDAAAGFVGLQLDLTAGAGRDALGVQHGSTLLLSHGSRLVAAGSALVQGSLGLSGSGTRLQAGRLGLQGDAALITLGSGTQLVADGFSSTANSSGRVVFNGGEFVVGGTADSSFSGLLEGSSGRLLKVGSGVVELGNPANTFSGEVVVRGGMLRAGPTALRLAQLTLESAGSLDARPDAAGQFSIGRLQGTFDVTLPGTRTLVLESVGNAAWRGTLGSDTVQLIKRGGGQQDFFGGTEAGPLKLASLQISEGASRLAEGWFTFGDAADLLIDGQGVLGVDGGAQVVVDAGIRLRQGGRLDVAGATTAVRSRASVFVLDGTSTLRVQQGARLQTERNLLVTSGSEAAPVGGVRVESGGHLEVAGVIQFEDPRATLTVDGGTLKTRALFTRAMSGFAGAIELSDPADGHAALTVAIGSRTGVDGPLAFAGTIRDAASGPGSLRKVDASTFPLLNPLQISGRLIVEGGQVQLTSDRDLESVTLVTMKDRPLDVSLLPVGEVLKIGALAGDATLSFAQPTSVELGFLHGRDARLGGALALSDARLFKLGDATQTFAGGAQIAELYVRGGAMVLEGGRSVVFGAQVQPLLAQPASGAALIVRGGAQLEVTQFLQLRNGPQPDGAGEVPGRLEVAGPGSGLNVVAASTLVQGGVFSVRDGALATLRGLGLRSASATAPSRVEVDRAQLVVSSVAQAADSEMALSDPVGASALTLRSAAANTTVVNTLFTRDGAGGPGSITVQGNRSGHVLNGRIESTGPLIAQGNSLQVQVNALVRAREIVAGPGTQFVYGAGTELMGSTLVGGAHRVIGSGSRFVDVAVASGTLLQIEAGSSASAQGVLSLQGGSRLVLKPGTSRLEGGTVQALGGEVQNDGQLLSTLRLGRGGSAQGSGSFGEIVVGAGGSFSPGNGVGAVTSSDAVLGALGRYEVDLADASGMPGGGFDHWIVAGTLDVQAVAGAGGRFTLALHSEPGNGAAAALSGFDPAQHYRWTVLSADSVSGQLDLNAFALDTSGFAPAWDGSFRVAWGDSGRTLDIVYAPIPEPGSWALMLLGGAGLAAWARRRRAGSPSGRVGPGG